MRWVAMLLLLITSGEALACSAPRLFFSQSLAVRNANEIDRIVDGPRGIKRDSPNCRYRLIGSVDVTERARGLSHLAVQRALLARRMFVERGLLEHQFVIQTEEPIWPGVEGLSMLDRVVSIHSLSTKGRATACFGVGSSCGICNIEIAEGEICHTIPGSGAR